MKWKRGKRARRHDNQALLVPDHPFHRADERHVKLVRERKVEQDRLAGCFLQLLKIKTGSECRDLLSETLGAHCYRVPVEAVAREGKNIGFFFARQPEEQRLVGGEQLLHFLHL
jgi:hypothetical protein